MKHWTKAEINFLTYNFKDMSAANISIELGRTQKAVEKKAEALGITGCKNVVWTEKELTFLINNFGKLSLTELTTLLPDRTYFAVANKISELHLGRQDGNTT